MIKPTEIAALLEGIGAMGVFQLLQAAVTARLSGGKKQAGAEPNGERRRLQDEVTYLRAKLDIADHELTWLRAQLHNHPL